MQEPQCSLLNCLSGPEILDADKDEFGGSLESLVPATTFPCPFRYGSLEIGFSGNVDLRSIRLH